MAAPAHRHQSSLEGLIDFCAERPLFADADERARAVTRFHRIVGHFEAIEAAHATSRRPGKQYNRPALVRLTFEYARSPESQDRFLAFFFQALAIDMLDGDLDLDGLSDFREPLLGVAEFLMTNFFLPLRASANKTPQPSPAHHAALQHVLSQEEQQRLQDFAGTPERLSALREACLVRDRHRCVASRAFDMDEATARFRSQGLAVDDDGNALIDSDDYEPLQVAHIIPYCLTRAAEGGEMDESKKATLAVLNMFDLGVVHLIEGPDMNRPYNAITLSFKMHRFFGQYEIFFDAMPERDTYRINSFLHPILSRPLPQTRTLFVHQTIDSPSERLLALHCAIAHILHLSGAGEYINKILKDMEDGMVCEDGSTELGILVDLALKVH